jgi:uncharacterized protein (DUF488 family)
MLYDAEWRSLGSAWEGLGLSLPDKQIFSVGHSTLPYEQFLELLRGAGVNAIADVRSAPYSRNFPHFNQDILSAELRRDGVAYAFLGRELGGRPAGAQFYCEGVADYEEMARSDVFKNGIDRVVAGTGTYRIALMCSERNPLDCHRCLLVGRELLRRQIDVLHILAPGATSLQSNIEQDLLAQAGYENEDMFSSRSERLAIAYQRRSRKVAFSLSTGNKFAAE